MNKQETTTAIETTKSTPARRVTRRTSQLDDNDETVEEISASPTPTRRSTRTRKNTTDDIVETPSRRNTRRGSAISESEAPQIQTGTPKRITRRSASIQSDDGNIPLHQTVQKPPSEATIKEEEAPIGRRTRANSITSDDGSVANGYGTPKKRGRKSLAASAKPIEPVIEEIEENQSPARPVTRSMSQSPANVSSGEKSSPLKPKSPLVTKTLQQAAGGNIEEGSSGNADETIVTIAKEVSQKLSNGSHESPDLLVSPTARSKTPQKNDSLLNSGKKGSDKTPNKSVTEVTTPKSRTKSPTAKEGTPVMTSNKKSPHTPASKPSSAKKSEVLISTPFPSKSVLKDDKTVFSKSWSQPVVGKAAVTPKIDGFGVKAHKRSSMTAIKEQTRTLLVSSSDGSDNDDDNDEESLDEFVVKEAEVAKHYESGDSMDEDEKALTEENRMHEELGEDIGSEDSGSLDDEEYDKDSFIVSEGNFFFFSFLPNFHKI